MLSLNEIDMIKSAALLNKAAQFKDIGKVYPISLSEIFEMGFPEYNRRLGTLLITETEIQDLIKQHSGIDFPIEEIKPLKYLLQCADQNGSFFLDLEKMFSTFFQEDITLLPKIDAVLVGAAKDKRLITDENFQDFQAILRIQNNKEVKAAPPKDETPGQRKMRLLREKVEEAKRKKAEKAGGDKQSFSTLLENASVYGIDIKNENMYSLYHLYARHQAREKYENDIKMLCAGASSENLNIKYWGDELSKD